MKTSLSILLLSSFCVHANDAILNKFQHLKRSESLIENQKNFSNDLDFFRKEKAKIVDENSQESKALEIVIEVADSLLDKSKEVNHKAISKSLAAAASKLKKEKKYEAASKTYLFLGDFLKNNKKHVTRDSSDDIQKAYLNSAYLLFLLNDSLNAELMTDASFAFFNASQNATNPEVAKATLTCSLVCSLVASAEKIDSSLSTTNISLYTNELSVLSDNISDLIDDLEDVNTLSVITSAISYGKSVFPSINTSTILDLICNKSNNLSCIMDYLLKLATDGSNVTSGVQSLADESNVTSGVQSLFDNLIQASSSSASKISLKYSSAFFHYLASNYEKNQVIKNQRLITSASIFFNIANNLLSNKKTEDAAIIFALSGDTYLIAHELFSCAKSYEKSGKVFLDISQHYNASLYYSLSADQYSALNDFDCAAINYLNSAKEAVLNVDNQLAANKYTLAAQSYLKSNNADKFRSAQNAYINSIKFYLKDEDPYNAALFGFLASKINIGNQLLNNYLLSSSLPIMALAISMSLDSENISIDTTTDSFKDVIKAYQNILDGKTNALHSKAVSDAVIEWSIASDGLIGSTAIASEHEDIIMIAEALQNILFESDLTIDQADLLIAIESTADGDNSLARVIENLSGQDKVNAYIAKAFAYLIADSMHPTLKAEDTKIVSINAAQSFKDAGNALNSTPLNDRKAAMLYAFAAEIYFEHQQYQDASECFNKAGESYVSSGDLQLASDCYKKEAQSLKKIS